MALRTPVRVGFVGAGHIARALARGWSRSEVARRPTLTFFDVSAQAAAEAADESHGSTVLRLVDLVQEADVVIVAVRPQHVTGVLAEVAPLLGARPLVSVAAGVPLEDLLGALPNDAKVGRVMPNVAAALGLGVFLFVPGKLGENEAEIEELFALAGDVVRVDESDFDTATAVAGCMPGILAMLVRDFARAAEQRGLAADVARRLAVAGVHGAAAVIAQEGDPAAVIAAAATPGGMTAAAISALEEREIASAVELAVHAAAERARGLT
jgi:pyrroline-5-carboxylate reductase